MRILILALILLATTAAVPGCGPHLDREELGEIQTEPADLPGAKQSYPVPEPQYETEREVEEDEGEEGEEEDGSANELDA